ncbi:MAG TPA: PQQ-binding-like beta-propeller repeat protein [Candidatus Angelobacter sp.]|jgi:outer membrane protein assembly factor BamB|nr:PQQ-binding-like beta-propeller repeat protein [Candidatus Angelobacter sp.]
MARKQRRRPSRGGGTRQPGAFPSPQEQTTAPTPPLAGLTRGPRRLLLITVGALIATLAIGAGLFSVVRGGGSNVTCDPDPKGWNAAGAGPANTSYAASGIKDPGPGWAPSWSYPPRAAQPSDRVTAPPAVANGTVYTATATGALVAIDAATGKEQWSSTPAPGEEGEVGTPIAIDGCAAALTTTQESTSGEPSGVMRAVDLRTHQRRWAVRSADEIFSAPQIIDGVAYAGMSFAAASGPLDRTHVLDGYYLSDGSRAYRKTFSAALTASPASDHTRIWIGALDQNLYALGPQGKQLWTYTTNGIVTLPAMYDSGSVYVASADHSVASLDATTGHEHWSVSVGEVQAAMADSGDTLVVADVDGTVHALNESDGSERWHADLGTRVTHGVVAAGDRIFVVDDDGGLHVLDRRTGNQTATWTAPAPPTGPPAIAAGHLYIACQDGRLYALPL